ncbi:MAG TPA: SCO family protein [Steroidobacteraceae bacterium]
MQRNALFAALALLSLWSSAAVASADDDALLAGVFSPPRLAPEFSLRGSDGTALSLSRYRGKVVLLSFGYTSCTEVCPITLAVLALAHRKLSTLADELQVVYITVDPERDNAERMRKYLTAFDPSFVGGTGTSEQLAAVRRDYGISLGKRVPVPGGYALSHSSFIYLIDREGALRALMPFGHSAEDFVHDVRLLLKK